MTMTRLMWGTMVLFAVLALIALISPEGRGGAFIYGITALYAGASARGVMSRAVAVTWGVLALCIVTAMAAFQGQHPPDPTVGWLGDDRVWDAAGWILIALASAVMAWRAEPIGAVEPTGASD